MPASLAFTNSPHTALAQSDFQRRAFSAAQAAHSAADRADARILMRIIEVVDHGDYPALAQLTQALQSRYRYLIEPLPTPGEQLPGAASLGADDQ